jgi:hypothetical protein
MALGCVSKIPLIPNTRPSYGVVNYDTIGNSNGWIRIRSGPAIPGHFAAVPAFYALYYRLVFENRSLRAR